MKKSTSIILAHVILIAIAVWAFWPKEETRVPMGPATPGQTAPGRKVTGPAVVRGIIGAEVRGLDPMDIGDTTSSGVAANILECLFQYDYLKDGILIPCLAEEMPTVGNGGVNEDGTLFNIKIKEGVLFQDDPCFADGKGRELLSTDFVYSWKRIADINNNSKNWSFLAERIVGLDAFREYTMGAKTPDYDMPVEGLTAIDAHTLQIKLTKAWPQVLYVLAHLPTAAVAREAVEYYKGEINAHPIGTGPFRLAKWERESEIVLERNHSWRGEVYPFSNKGLPQEPDAGKYMPFIDQARYRIILEDQPAWLTFMKGESDVSGIPKDFFQDTIRNNKLTDEMVAKGINLLTATSPSVSYIGFNMEDPIVGKNKPLRQAMSLAVNREEFIEIFANGRGVPANGPIPPEFPAFDPTFVNPYCQFNLELASAKLAEAVALNGGPLPKLTLDLPGTDTTSRQQGEYYVDTFAKIGLEIEVEYNTWPKFQDKIKSKTCRLFTLGWVADYPDAENFLFLFYGKNVSPGPNNANYVNPEFDALFEKATMMFDSPERRAQYQQLSRMIVEDCPWIFLSHPKAYTLYYDWVKNIRINHFAQGTLKYRRIDVGLRDEMTAGQ